jgi:hypothetical protein
MSSAARRQLVPQNARGIHEMLERNRLAAGKLASFVAGSDVFAARGTTRETIADQYRIEGIHLMAANTDRINGAARVLQLLGDAENDIPQRLFIFSRCRRLVDTLPILEHNPNNPEDVLKVDTDEDGNGGDDAYDSARYGLMAIPRGRHIVMAKYV